MTAAKPSFANRPSEQNGTFSMPRHNQVSPPASLPTPWPGHQHQAAACKGMLQLAAVGKSQHRVCPHPAVSCHGYKVSTLGRKWKDEHWLGCQSATHPYYKLKLRCGLAQGRQGKEMLQPLWKLLSTVGCPAFAEPMSVSACR